MRRGMSSPVSIYSLQTATSRSRHVRMLEGAGKSAIIPSV